MKEKVREKRYLSLKSLQISPYLRAREYTEKYYRSFFILSFAREELTLSLSACVAIHPERTVSLRRGALSLKTICSAGKREFESELEGTRKKLSLPFFPLNEDETASLSLEKHRYSRDDVVVVVLAPIFILRLRRLPGAQQRVQTNVRFTHARHDVHIRGFKLDSAKLDANGARVSFRQSNER